MRKEISYKSMNQKEKNQLIDEFRILKSLVHPNIVQYYHHEHVAEESAVHLYMEYCGGGDLASIISTCKQTGEYVPESMVWSVFTQLSLALYRCHYNSDPPPVGELFNCSESSSPPQPATVILHRDIKPDNVFLDQFNSVKLGDFGLAKILDQEHFMANTYVGTPYYMSPEVLLDKPFTPQSDIWSLGCVIYELCARHPPFQAKTHLQLSHKIRDGIYPALPSVYSQTLSKTIAACLNQNYLQRPTTSTLLRLDVMKLCRKEREVNEAHREIQDIREQILIERETVMKQMQAQQEQQQMQMLQQIQEEFNIQLEQEVQRRVNTILQEQSMSMNHLARQPSPEQKPASWQHDMNFAGTTSPVNYKQSFASSNLLSSPSDVVMTSAQNTPVPSRNVRGLRTILHNSFSPTFSRSPPKTLDSDDEIEIESPSCKPHVARNRMLATKSASMDTNRHNNFSMLQQQNKHYADETEFGHKFSDDVCSASTASASTFSSRSSQFSSSSDTSHSSYEMDRFEQHLHNTVPLKDQPAASSQPLSTSVPTTPRDRQSPHFQAIYEAKKSIVSKAAMAKVKGVKIPAIGRRAALVRKNTAWDEPIYSDEMPSPFLRPTDQRHWHDS